MRLIAPVSEEGNGEADSEQPTPTNRDERILSPRRGDATLNSETSMVTLTQANTRTGAAIAHAGSGYLNEEFGMTSAVETDETRQSVH